MCMYVYISDVYDMYVYTLCKDQSWQEKENYRSKEMVNR